MELRKWSELPDFMRTKEVRRYYNILVKKSAWFKAKRLLDIIVAFKWICYSKLFYFNS